eukprot:jgi/Chlat1/346/Chrsp10S01517
MSGLMPVLLHVPFVVLVLLLVHVGVGVKADDVDPLTPLPPRECGWDLVWSDEFAGPQLDGSKWTPQVDCWGGGNNEAQCYTSRSDNVYIDTNTGQLALRATYEQFTTNGTGCTQNDGCAGTRDYTSGKVMTDGKAAWTYGFVSVRAKVPKGQGLWPAVWMMPEDDKYGGWAASGEIDILETTGQTTNTAQGTIFYGDNWPRQVSHTSGKTEFSCVEDLSADFHTYSLEWGRDYLRWFVDGTVFFTQALNRSFTEPGQASHYSAFRQPFDQPFFLILNLAVG